MRRQKPISARVKAPSRGLVTRYPSETADLMQEGDQDRVATVAQNMRFVGGTAQNAAGYERVNIVTPLLANMVAHWRFDEAGGNRADSVGRNILEDTSQTILSAEGKLGKAAVLIPDLGNLEGTFTLPDPAPMTMGDIDFTICGWFNVPSVDLADSCYLLYKASDYTDYTLRVSGTSLTLTVGDAATGLTTTQITSSVTLSASTWYFFAVRHDSVANKLYLRVNSTEDNIGYSAGVFASANGFAIGSGTAGTLIDSYSVWKRFLSSDELDTVFNSGDGLNYPFLGNAFCFIFQANLISADPSEPLILGTSQSLYLADRTYQADPRQFNLSLTTLYSGGSADSEYRWSGTNFFDKVVVAQNNIVPQYWVTGGTFRDLPGLAVVDEDNNTDDTYTGVFSFTNHLILWRDNKIKWSDVNDFSNWVPVASTIASLRLTLTNSFVQPAADATTDWLDVDETLAGLTVGQYVRIDDEQSSLPYYNFYIVDSVSPAADLTATTVAGGSQTVTGSATTKILVTESVAWTVGQRVVCGSDTNILTVAEVSTSLPTAVLGVVSPSIPNAPTTFDLTLSTLSTAFAVGDYISLGTTATPSNDIFKISAVAVAAGPVTKLTVVRTGLGTNPLAGGAGNTYPAGAIIIKQPYVSLTKSTAGDVTVPASTSITEKYACRLTLQNFTGRTATGATISASKQIVTLDANEAGETFIVGDDTNGPIYQGMPLGDYAYLFKSRSIHAVMPVGRQSGVFAIRTVLTNEGLISRNSLVKIANGQCYFLGHRNFYSFSGGSEPTPICQQFTRQLFEELDRTRLNEINLFHNEEKQEVWLLYPTSLGTRVLVYNYFENSCSLDFYDEILGGISAAGSADWLLNPSWSVLADSQTWELTDPTVSWASLIGGGKERQAIIATGNGEMFVHGHVFNRDGEAYTSLFETKDFDFEDSTRFKTVDVVHVGLQVVQKDNVTRNLYVQVGTRSTLDADITWRPARAIPVQGNANFTAKVNPGGSGRYIRLRFFSNEVDCQWRVSSFEIYCRPGGTY
jgi:Concanavalin A-like lectin/glucanases superfamily